MWALRGDLKVNKSLFFPKKRKSQRGIFSAYLPHTLWRGKKMVGGKYPQTPTHHVIVHAYALKLHISAWYYTLFESLSLSLSLSLYLSLSILVAVRKSRQILCVHKTLIFNCFTLFLPLLKKDWFKFKDKIEWYISDGVGMENC